MLRTLSMLVVLAVLPLCGATKVVVTVVEQKTGAPVTGLKALDFTVSDDKVERKVESAEYTKVMADIMLLVDTSLVGPVVQPVAAKLIGELQEKEQMALVSFHSSADLIQDFTSSRDALLRALGNVKFGNSPRMLDALYAAIDGGFQSSNFRRVILLLTTGLEGPSRMSERQVIRLARRSGVSIYPVFMGGYGRSLFESLARQTAGAPFSLREMEREHVDDPSARIFEVIRNHYSLSVAGNLGLGEKFKITVKYPRKTFVSALPPE